MLFNNAGSTMSGTSWEAIAFELTSQLQVLEHALELDRITISPDPDNQTCDFDINLETYYTAGDGIALIGANYVNDGTYSKGSSDMPATTLVNAIITAWTVIGIGIQKGQLIEAYSNLSVSIETDFIDRELKIRVTDFPCLIATNGISMTVTPIECLVGSHTFTNVGAFS
jgi:hypothetical protein